MGLSYAEIAGRKSRHSRVVFGARVRRIRGVTKLCIFIGTAIGGYAGWGLGDAVGLGFGWAFVLSGIGSMIGVWAGWKLAQKIEE